MSDDRTFHGVDVLVTGGSGFIGSHLVDVLLDRGANVVVFDDFSAGARSNLPVEDGGVELVRGSVLDRDQVADLVDDVDIVYHLAANAHVPTSVERPAYDFQVNAQGTQVVLDEARKSAVDRVVFASSAAVYGPPREMPMDEDHPLAPVSPYGASKLAGEQLGRTYHESYDTEFTGVRIFNTFGPRQSKFVMYDFLRKLEEDSSRLEVLGSGREVRAFAYVSDTAEALATLGSAPAASGEIYNFGGDEPTSIRGLAELIAERYYGGEPEIVTTGEPKPGDIPKLVPDTSKLRSLGVEPTVSLSEGLDEFVDWFRSRGP